jgi:phosphatidylserine/phosphatidylglycerophosphate/cardiolipin synthase-like enzyme/uncharacterized membrane protein YdjX (TVP38/TMEM64 family)
VKPSSEGARASTAAPDHAAIAVEGTSCWRRVRAGRVAVLVDVECYYTAVAEALACAERSILIAGWDIHSELRLRRDGDDPGAGPGLRDLLVQLVERRRRLHVHILIWDFSMVFALEREMFPVLKLGWQTPRRIHFHLDDHHPLGASQHQKIVVVDDAVAFSGGVDLTIARWDTRRHLAEDPRRTDVGKPTGPTHDVQVAVDGEAAKLLGDVVRERWRRATGHRLRAPRPARTDRWPASLPVDFHDVDIALARTVPAFDEEHEVREVERLYLDSIAAARRSLYIENQYFTSPVVADALAARLEEPDGPDVVYIGPLRCSGWLEEITMGVLRGRLLRRLAAADRHGRFRAYWVAAAGDASVPVVVHSKVMVVDERLARIGSANLSSRSMGLDSECDVAVEACGDPTVAEAIARLRDDLLAEHLDVRREAVANALAGGERLTALVERLRAQGGRLAPLEPPPESALDVVMPDSAFIDLERPAATEELLRRVLADQPVRDRRRPLIGLTLVLAALTLVGVAWRVGPLAEWLDPARVAAVARGFAEHPFGPVLAAALFVPAGFVMAPAVVLIVAAGLVFGPWIGFVVALLGSFASALATYAAGRWLWQDTVRRLGGKRLNRVSRRLARRGVLAVIALRVVPVAPFTVINLAAGASHIGFRDYALGSLLGMAPGSLALTVLAGQIRATWENPDPRTFAALAGVGLLVVVVLLALRRTLGGERAR